MTTPFQQFKLGKTPARKDAVTFKLANYVDLDTVLPTVPAKVGHPGLLPLDLGMLGNDQYGDCVWAGAAHETMLFNLEAKSHADFTDSAVLSDYSKVTGFNPSDPSTDQGTDMGVAASYRRKTGIVDKYGIRHKVIAYLAIEPGNLHQLKAAIYLFGAVGIGIEFPASAMDQFNAGKSWGYVRGSQIEGGHYIPGVYADTHGFQIITWGRRIRATNAFLEHYCDEAIAYVSAEALIDGRSIEGFDQATLLKDLAALPASK